MTDVTHEQYMARLDDLRRRIKDISKLIERDGVLPGAEFLVKMLEENIAELEALTKND